jgi:hypothetical protein
MSVDSSCVPGGCFTSNPWPSSVPCGRSTFEQRKVTQEDSMATEAKAEVEEVKVDKDQLAILRDGEHLSWAKVADRLELGSPAAARRIYTKLIRPHTESVLPGRTKAAVTPVDLTGSDLAQLREQLVGRAVVVDRDNGHQETIPVVRVTSLKDGNIAFNDGSKARTVKASAGVAVR